jgi:hypothetical protein
VGSKRYIWSRSVGQRCGPASHHPRASQARLSMEETGTNEAVSAGLCEKTLLFNSSRFDSCYSPLRPNSAPSWGDQGVAIGALWVSLQPMGSVLHRREQVAVVEAFMWTEPTVEAKTRNTIIKQNAKGRKVSRCEFTSCHRCPKDLRVGGCA